MTRVLGTVSKLMRTMHCLSRCNPAMVNAIVWSLVTVRSAILFHVAAPALLVNTRMAPLPYCAYISQYSVYSPGGTSRLIRSQ